MNKFSNTINKISRGYTRVLIFLSGLLLLGTVFCVVLAVLNRTIIKTSMFWTEEAARIMLVWLAMIAPSIQIISDEHFRMVFFYNRLFKGKAADGAWLVIEAFCMLVVTYIMIYGYRLTYQVRNQQLPTIKAPISLMYGAVPVGMACMLFAFSLCFIGKIIEMSDKNKLSKQEGA